MPSSQLAHQMREQASSGFDEPCLDPWMSMSNGSTLQPAPSWATNSWEIDPNEVQICLDSKNRPWQLGSGGFGSVRSPTPFFPGLKTYSRPVQEFIDLRKPWKISLMWLLEIVSNPLHHIFQGITRNACSIPAYKNAKVSEVLSNNSFEPL